MVRFCLNSNEEIGNAGKESFLLGVLLGQENVGVNRLLYSKMR